LGEVHLSKGEVMANVRIKINEAGLRLAGQDAVRAIQDEVNRSMRTTIERVGREMAGKPAADVYKRLVSEMRKDLGARVTPNEPELRKIAAEISADGRAED
jgi:hypothetical protein